MPHCTCVAGFALNFPYGHRVHSRDPAAMAWWCGKHCVHSNKVLASLYVPAAHDTHEVPVVYCPAAHFWQLQ